MNLNDLKQTKNIKCYNCEKKRHKKKNCKTSTLDALKVLKSTAKHVKIDKDLNVLVNIWVSRSHMSWTACYDDDCFVHKSDKEESEWYSKKSRKKKIKNNKIELS